MGHWNYQCRKRTVKPYAHMDNLDQETKDYEETYYELVEAYPDVGNDPCGNPTHTMDSVTITANSREDLARMLRAAADDVMKYDVIDGDHPNYNDEPTVPTVEQQILDKQAIADAMTAELDVLDVNSEEYNDMVAAITQINEDIDKLKNT